MLPQQVIQSRVERVARGRGEIRRRYPHGRLPRAFAFAHRHGAHSSTLRVVEDIHIDEVQALAALHKGDR
jgi:hypothetical protein